MPDQFSSRKMRVKIAGLSGVDERTIAKYLSGGRVLPPVQEAIDRAMTALCIAKDAARPQAGR